MPFEVDIPKLGESVNEVTVLEWLCADGDYVDKDEPICVLETDKATSTCRRRRPVFCGS